ncbi:MAG: oxygen-dependent coproporphyrinogen oxidase [Leptospirales bacterium]|nr:oxygen-dependent coproporphyrinogen oxidase [Leptospirales bacterium]
MNYFPEFTAFLRNLQDRITGELDQLEHDQGSSIQFQSDEWKGEDWLAGGGRTRVIEEGLVLERGGVNISDVHGQLPDDLAQKMPGDSRDFRAAGISLVLHPRNPHAPTVHANFRMICRGNPESPEKLWFGGGGDLTPMYLYEDDAAHFHSIWRSVCEAHSNVASYAKMKKDCDQYFYLPHRKEARGIGGIFYDYMQESPTEMLAFSRAAGNAFLDAYLPILRKRSIQPWTAEEREFQLWRRGRYVEFNLAFDRGTQFGLKTGGRIESILMSLPPLVRYKYNYTPAQGREAEIMAVLRTPRDWI